VTTPHEEHPAGTQATPEEAAAGVPGTPRVTTAPPRARRRFGGVPARLGRARTSTVVIAVVWLLVALLWLDVRPPSARIAPTSGTDGAGQTATTTAPARTGSNPPESTAPTSSASRTSAAPSAPSTGPTTTAPGGVGTTPTPTTAVPTRTPGGTASVPVPPPSGAAPTT
jgi:cytoskeletal protein RodZ